MEKDRRAQEKPKGKAAPVRGMRFFLSALDGIPCQRALILAVTSLILALLITPSFTVHSPDFQLGDIADRNVKAKRDFLVEDAQATTLKREEAVRQAAIVYDLDDNILPQTQERIEAAFRMMRQFLAENDYSVLGKGPAANGAAGSDSRAGGLFLLETSAMDQHVFLKKKDFDSLLGVQAPVEIYTTLVEMRFGQDVEEKILTLLKSIHEKGVVSSKAWQPRSHGENLVVRKASTGEEFLLPPPHAYMEVEEARKFAMMQALEQGRDVKEMAAISFLTSQLLQHNLTFNLEETDRRREQAYAAVKPVFLKIKKNEMLVREGQRIGQTDLLKLRVQEQGIRGRHWFFVFVVLFLFSGLCNGVVVHVSKQHLPSFRIEMRDILFLSVLLILLLSLGRSAMWVADLVGDNIDGVSGRGLLFAVPLTAGAMMATIFFGVTVSFVFTLLLTLFAGMLFGKDFGLFFYCLIGSVVAAHGVSPCRNRMVPIKAGLMVGCVNVIVIFLSSFLQEQWVFMKAFTNAFMGFCGGIFAGIFVTGLTPLVEMFFGYNTDIKLLELATMDQPLMQELMVQAPGTYHHSIIVGNMVESAAKSISANSLLAKVAAYYHDIGKIKKSLYFIENQFDCENRHEKLAPSMSSLILISHVREGAELARQHRLGKDIVNIISQHHGKSFISFFYKKAVEAREKAKSTKGADLPPINMDDYRYPGPKPQTKEAGLVMLADVVEAACRSLSDPTPARIQGMVNRLINNIFSDGQLDECELTLKDLHSIAKHFNQILATVHHKRIEYPTLPAPNGKGKSDAPDSCQRESRSDRDKPAANRENSRTDLKRLGIH